MNKYRAYDLCDDIKYNEIQRFLRNRVGEVIRTEEFLNLLDDPDELKFLAEDIYDHLPRLIDLGIVNLVDQFLDLWLIVESPERSEYEYLDQAGVLGIGP